MIIKTSKEIHGKFKKELNENVSEEFLIKLMTEIDKFYIRTSSSNKTDQDKFERWGGNS